ncbi:MAG: DUF58 domain-containing protein [Gemmataceae bacterium]
MRRFDPTALARYGRLSMVARTVVEGFISGLHQSPYKGFSVEFAEHRQYYPGDEIRHLDWRVLGKTDRLYVKEYEQETNLQAYLVLDSSGSMGFRGKSIAKLEYAQHVAASLAYLMLHQLDAVGLMVHDAAIRDILPPSSNPKQLLRILQTLEKASPHGETSLGALWDKLAHQARRRGMIILLSDCFDQIEPLLLALRRLRHRRHEVLLFHVLAPEEIEFPFARLTQFRNLEAAADKMLLDPRRLRQEYLKNFQTFCAALKRGCTDIEIDYHLLRTDEPIDRALGIYLSKRLARK